MAKKLIVIVEPDEGYLSALEYKFAEEWNDTAQIEAISSLKYLNDYFEEPRSIYILLINEFLYSSKIARHECTHTFLITEEEKQFQEENGIFSIYRYMGVPDIYRKIERQVQKMRERKRGNSAHLTVVTSVTGGCGKTLLSLGIAGELSAREQETLYISAEALQDFWVYLKKESYAPERFCHALATREDRLAELLKEILAVGEFSYLPPLPRTAASYQIEPEDYSFLADCVKGAGCWQEIVMEVPSFTGNIAVGLLERAEHVVIITGADRNSEVKLRTLSESVPLQEDKYIFICNRCPSSETELQIPGVEIAEYIEEFRETPLTLEKIREKGILRNIAYLLA